MLMLWGRELIGAFCYLYIGVSQVPLPDRGITCLSLLIASSRTSSRLS